MALPKKIKKQLDALDDELFLAYLSFNYGHNESIWEECTQAEYEKFQVPINAEWNEKTFEKYMKYLGQSETYKAEPFYKNKGGGLLWQMEYHEPDGYRYYKKVGQKFVITLGSDMMDYCATRKCMQRYFQNNQIR